METSSPVQPHSKKRRYPLYIVGVIILLLIIWVISAFYIGKQIEDKKNDYLSQLNDSNFSLINEQISLMTGKSQQLVFSDFSNYHRGIFSSSADLNIALKDDSSDKISPLGTIKITMNHGPFPLLSNGNFTPELFVASADIENMALLLSDHIHFKEKPIAKLILTKGFNPTSLSGSVSISPFEINILNTVHKSSITNDGIVFKFNRDNDNIKTSVDISPTKLAINTLKDTLSFEVDKITTGFDGNVELFLKYGTLMGKNNITVNDISAFYNATPLYNVKRIVLEDMSQKDDQNRLSGQGTLSVDDVALLNMKLGQITSDFGYGNIDLDLISVLNHTHRYNKNTELTDLFLTQTNSLLSKNPFFNINTFTWKNDYGISENKFGITLQPTDNQTLASFIYNPLTVMPSIIKKANMNISIPKAMAVKTAHQLFNNALAFSHENAGDDALLPKSMTEEQVAAQLDQWILIINSLSNSIVEDNNVIKSNISYENSIIDLNGQKINLTNDH